MLAPSNLVRLERGHGFHKCLRQSDRKIKYAIEMTVNAEPFRKYLLPFGKLFVRGIRCSSVEISPDHSYQSSVRIVQGSHPLSRESLTNPGLPR